MSNEIITRETARKVIDEMPNDWRLKNCWNKERKLRKVIVNRVLSLLQAGEEITAETRLGGPSPEDIQRREEAAMQRMERERAADAKIESLLAFACEKMQACGWKLEHRSGFSMYFVKNGCRFRISDHCVPATGERDHNTRNGGFSWQGRDEQIIINTKYSEESLAEEIENLG